MLTAKDIRCEVVLKKGRTQIKVVGSKGKTTVMVVNHPHPMSSRPAPARGIRMATLLRDWVLVTPAGPTVLEPGTPCTCGQPLPWHLVEIAREKFTAHCRQIDKLGKGCGRAWQGTKDGKLQEVVE